MKLFLFFVVAPALLIGSCAAMFHKTPEQKAEEARKRKQIEDDLAKQKAEADAKNAELNEKLRKACKMPKDVKVEAPTHEKVVERCHDTIYMNAKVPGSVSFPFRDSELGFTSPDGCKYEYTSQFDGKNAFGVEIRTRYTCTYDPVTTLASVRTP